MTYMLLDLLLLSFVHCAQSYITISGTKFFNATDGNQFYFKGVVYSPGTGNNRMLDVLAHPTQCAIDAPLLKELGANTISVYYIDPTLDHDECTKTFAEENIQILIDLDGLPPFHNHRWNKTFYDRYTSILDDFVRYDNLLGFIVGNELVKDDTEVGNALSIKAAVRDIKAYSRAKGYRKVPIGYFTKDPLSTEKQLAEFLVCGETTDATIDFFGLDVFSWCGRSTYAESGYQRRTADFRHLPIPIFFSEDGCHDERPRRFLDQSTIFGSEMVDVWSGATVYEWLQEDFLNYGLVSYSSSDVLSGTPTPMADYHNLKTQWATLSPPGVHSTHYTWSGTTPACPTTDVLWTVDPMAELPAIDGIFGARSQQLSSVGTTGVALAVGIVVIALTVGFFLLYRKTKSRLIRKNSRRDAKPDGSDRDRLLESEEAFLAEDGLALFDVGEREDEGDVSAVRASEDTSGQKDDQPTKLANE